jgi:hypothetical protein
MFCQYMAVRIITLNVQDSLRIHLRACKITKFPGGENNPPPRPPHTPHQAAPLTTAAYFAVNSQLLFVLGTTLGRGWTGPRQVLPSSYFARQTFLEVNLIDFNTESWVFVIHGGGKSSHIKKDRIVGCLKKVYCTFGRVFWKIKCNV